MYRMIPVCKHAVKLNKIAQQREAARGGDKKVTSFVSCTKASSACLVI